MSESKRFQINNKDINNIVKVFLWSTASAVVAVAIAIVAEVDGGQYAMVIPLINTGLVALKKFIDDKGCTLPHKK